MAFQIGNETDSTAIGQHGWRFGQAAGIESFAMRTSIVTALDVDGRAQQVNEIVGSAFGKDGHIINAGQGRENFSAFHFWDQRSTCSFELAHTLVTIEAKDQKIPQAARVLQIAHMTQVEQVKAAVGEDSTFTHLLSLTNNISQFVAWHYFLSRINCQFRHYK